MKEKATESFVAMEASVVGPYLLGMVGCGGERKGTKLVVRRRFEGWYGGFWSVEEEL